MTRQQQLIYDIVASGPAHPTAEEVFVRAREALPSLARGTVYRNLGRLTEEGRSRMLGMMESYAPGIAPGLGGLQK